MAKKKMDSRIKKYNNKKGTFYQFQLYCGVNELTGKKQYTRRRGFKSIEEASLELQRLEYEVSQNQLQIKNKIVRFKDLYLDWFENYKQKVRESTWSSTETIFKKHILPKFGDYIIDKITVQICQQHVNEWAKLSPKNFNKYKNYTSNILKYAMSLELTVRNPMQAIIIPRGLELKKEEKNISFYTKDELITFLNTAKEYSQFTYTFFHLLAYTGLRKSEALALQWSDINYFNKTLTVNKTLTRGHNNRIYLSNTKTKTGDRIISLDQQTIQILQEFQGKIIDLHGYIFARDDGKLYNPSSVKKWIQPIIKKSKLKPISPHGFRHTHASLLAEAGVSLKDIQDRLGHADIQTTANIYTHVTQGKRDATAEKLVQFMQQG